MGGREGGGGRMRRSSVIVMVTGLWLRLQGGGLALGFFTFYVDVVVPERGLLAALEHVVGPLGAAAAAPPVDEAAAAPRRERAAASAPVVDPGFLSIAIVVLGGERRRELNTEI